MCLGHIVCLSFSLSRLSLSLSLVSLSVCVSRSCLFFSSYEVIRLPHPAPSPNSFFGLSLSPLFLVCAHTNASRSLADLDPDTLLCVARYVSPGDWFFLALQGTSTRDACKAAYLERHREVYGEPPAGTETGPAVRWRTYASSSRTRLDWVVKHMGYIPTTRTLCDVAFRGDVTVEDPESSEHVDFYDYVRGGLPGPWESYQVCHSAGASGRCCIVRHIDDLSRNKVDDDGPHVYSQCVPAMIDGVVGFDRVDLLKTFYDPGNSYTTERILCQSASLASEKVLKYVLETRQVSSAHAPSEAALFLRVLQAAVESGCVSVLSLVCGSFSDQMQSLDRNQKEEFMRTRMFRVRKEEDLEARFFGLTEPRHLPDHREVFRYMVEQMHFYPPPDLILPVVLFGDLDVVRYLHEAHYPMCTWLKTAWTNILVHQKFLFGSNSSRGVEGVDTSSYMAKVVALDPTLRLDSDLLLWVMTGWVETSPDFRVDEIKRYETVEVVRKACHLVWSEACMRMAVSNGLWELAQKMLKDGVPFDKGTILEDAVTLLDTRRTIVCFSASLLDATTVVHILCLSLLSKGAVWTPRCIESVAQYDMHLRQTGEANEKYVSTIQTLVMNGAPYDESMLKALNPVVARRLTLRER